MSPENVELLRDSIAAFNRGDFETWAQLAAPDFEFVQAREVPGAGTYRGREAMERFLQDFLEAWEHIAVEIEELIDVDPAVVAVTRVHARGKTSGAHVDAPFVYVCTFRDGKIIRNQVFADRTDALDAVGLRE